MKFYIYLFLTDNMVLKQNSIKRENYSVFLYGMAVHYVFLSVCCYVDMVGRLLCVSYPCEQYCEC